ncbi:MAG: hypothetical protein MUO77_06150 [Anaerolineales bacterium]|nr:hypothetical protein [Anaerolineales bacterium]
MKKFKSLFVVLLLLALAVIPASSAHALGFDDGSGGKVIFGENFTLAEDEMLDGDLVVFGGNVTIENGATVTGSVVVFGGTITQDGLIEGDIVVFGGQISVGEEAVVEGDAVTIGGQLDVAEGGEIEGERVTNVPAPKIELPDMPNAPVMPNMPNAPIAPFVDYGTNPLFDGMNVITRAVAIAALAMLVSVFLQPQIEQVSQTIMRQPLTAGSFGLLTVFIAPLALVILTVTILLIPVALVAALLLVLIWLFGLIAIGQEVGERFTKAINQTWAPVLTIGFGTFLLMLVGGSVALVPCVGWLAPVVIGLVGIGGVMMSWFSSRQAKGPGMIVPVELVPPAA